ncbi:helix-turn-helix domain-containing protein [Albimonas pacifica]|uniref:helix-turn-helix domain-containing protein n=1 Tax=Albimonas pacifica TaxID=1114924 RepID=UPI000B83B6C4|nr:helix-turn-helix transcriptional regulator [Albimonas pacifica]
MDRSEIGEFLRVTRAKKGYRLKHLADALEVSSAFLSAVEFGRKPVPRYWREPIVKFFGLSEGDTEKLSALIDRAQGSVTITPASPEESGLIAAYERVRPMLTPVQLELFTQELKRAGEKGHET